MGKAPSPCSLCDSGGQEPNQAKPPPMQSLLLMRATTVPYDRGPQAWVQPSCMLETVPKIKNHALLVKPRTAPRANKCLGLRLALGGCTQLHGSRCSFKLKVRSRSACGTCGPNQSIELSQLNCSSASVLGIPVLCGCMLGLVV